jgi:zinc finger protein|tara:strand:- start:1936 stop:2469 length:534 start_codon:yes stop_codon:yes gene_type:complete
MEELKKQKCIFCGKDTLTLMQDEVDVAFFGKVFVFSMKCDNPDCNYSKSDIEAAEIKDPCKITFAVESEKDLSVRVIKSSNATIKVSALKMDVRPGPASDGFISNIEGLLNRFKKVIEGVRDNTDDDKERKSAKNLLKKLWKVQCGDLPIKIVIEDPTGNSGIISDKAIVEKLKVKK